MRYPLLRLSQAELLLCLLCSPLSAQNGAPHAAWVTVGAGLGTLARNSSSEPAWGLSGIVDGSYQRTNTLISVRLAATVPLDYGDGLVDCAVLLGRATDLQSHYAALSIGLGLGRRSAPDDQSWSLGASAAARTEVNARPIGLGLYGFGHLGRDSFAGVALTISIGEHRPLRVVRGRGA